MNKRLGLRGKLFVATFLGLVGIVAVTAAVLDVYFGSLAEQAVERHLQQQSLAIRDLLVKRLAAGEGGHRQIVSQVAEATDTWITLVAPDGRSVVDVHEHLDLPESKDVALDALSERQPSNLSRKPEVGQALDGGLGFRFHYASDLETSLAMMAIPFDLPEGRGALKVVMYPSFFHEARQNLRWGGIIGGGLLVLLASMFNYIVLRYYMQSLYALRKDALDIQESGLRSRISLQSDDELGWIATTFNAILDELETALDSLGEERDRFAAILEGMKEGVLAVDGEGRIKLINGFAKNLFGLTESPTGRHILEAIRVPAVQELLSRPVHEAGLTFEFEIHAPEHRVILAYVAPLRRKAGKVLVFHDVTELRHLEHIRQDFIANVSHELRTPVTIIQANAETLLDGAVDDPVFARKFVTSLHQNSERLKNLINDILDLSRLEAGSWTLNNQEIPLEPFVRSVIDSIDTLAAEKEIAISLSITAGQAVKGDAKALEQVLVNLISNGIKYTPIGGKVNVYATARDEMLEIVVEDNGPGIPLSKRERLFERFYRIDSGRSKKMGGTGLGLAIVKHLVQTMGGEVGMRSAWPSGSAFWFTLPRAEHGEDALPSAVNH